MGCLNRFDARTGAFACQTLHLDTRDNPNPALFDLLGQPVHRFGVVRIPPPLLMQDRGNALRLPIAKHGFHVRIASIRTFDKLAFITDCSLLLINRGHVFTHRFARNLHIAHRMIAEAGRIAFPNIYGMRHKFPHRRLKIIIAYHAAGNSRRSGRNPRFV